MSKTFNISSDQDVHVVPWTQRDLKLSISSEDHYSNTSLSPSESSSSISNLSHREANSPDVDIQEFCVSTVDNPLIDLSQRNMLFVERAKLNQTFIATPVSSNVNFWNENRSEMSNHETGYDNNSSFINNTEDGCNHSVTSLDSAEKASQLCPCTTPHRGSAENDCCSLSSGEMVLRSNSFCLEEQSHLVVSSLEDSSTSLPAGHQAMLAESNLSTSFLDVCKKSQETPTENTNHLRLSMTFIQTEVPNEESDKGTSSCLVTLPSESEGGLLMTFVCETQSADCGKDQFASAEPQLLHFPATYTPEQGKTFVSTLSAVQDSNDDIHTSTPIQNVGNKIPSLPSFSESPCTGKMGSSGQHPVKHQQMPDTSNRLAVGLPLSNSKVKKIKIKKFPKSDFSSVKSKVMTRNFHQISLPDPASLHKPSQVHVNKCSDAHKGTSIRISTADVKMVNDAQRHVKTGAASVFYAVDGHRANGSCSPPTHQAANKHSATQSSDVGSETKFSAQQAGNQTFYISSLGNSPDRSGQTNSKPTPKKAMSNKVEARAGSALGQDKPPVPKTRPRCSSESSLSSRPIKEKKTILRISNSFIVPRPDPHFSQANLWNQNFSTKNKQAVQDETMNSPNKNSTREFKKISLVKVSNKSKMAGTSRDESKGRFRGRLSPKRTGGTPLPHAPAVTLIPAPSSARQRRATCDRDECRASKDIHTPQPKQKSTPGRQGPLATGKASLGTTFAASVKPQLSIFLHCTPTRSSVTGHPPTPASKLPCKTQGRPRSLTEVLHVEPCKVSGGTTGRPTLIKSTLAKTRVGTTPSKNFGKPAVATSCKTPASTSKGASNLMVTPLQRTPSARCARVTSNAPVDKNKPKASSHQQQASQQNQSNGPPDVVPARVTGTGRKDQSIQRLRELLAASNCRFEAIAIVLQQTLAERDEATRQCRALSQELVHLRGELGKIWEPDCSVQSSELLEKEKEELRVALEGALQKLQEQHQKDLVELEQRLQAFYQTEWDKAHLTYQEEANKCRRLMEQQIEEVQSNHEAMKQELKDSHAEQLQCVNLHYELSLEELCKVHNQELQSREKSLKDTESALNGQIEALTAENNVLIEKLTAEENRRKQLAENSQKDAHTLYLEQELESLKVVLDIKNEQLHQQEKKLMEVDTLKDKNVKLNESLNKVQQENEELSARMDKHAALTRQLSTEQAVLQESLQKESKVNKRLSMENEELLWKLQNGDPSCSRRVSPTSTSPSHSFSLQSPCNSSLLSSPPMSPR